MQQNWSKKCTGFSLWSDKPCSANCKGGSNQRNDSCNSDIAHSTLVSSASGNVNSGAPFLPKQNNILKDPLENKHPLVMNNTMTFCDVEDLWKNLIPSGIGEGQLRKL